MPWVKVLPKRQVTGSCMLHFLSELRSLPARFSSVVTGIFMCMGKDEGRERKRERMLCIVRVGTCGRQESYNCMGLQAT